MALASRRPQRRRRRWLLLALLITLIVLAVNAAVSSRSASPAARQASLAYLDSVRPLADQSYSLFVAALPPTPGATALPPSQWAADQESWTQPMLATFVASLRSSAALSPVHDVSVVLVSMEPTAVGMEGPVSVLPQAKNL